MAALYEWVSGFEEAIALREELWDPEEYPDISDRKKEELYHSMMTIQGLVDPVEVMDYFEDMPDEVFQEAFSGMDSELYRSGGPDPGIPDGIPAAGNRNLPGTCPHCSEKTATATHPSRYPHPNSVRQNRPQ